MAGRNKSRITQNKREQTEGLYFDDPVHHSKLSDSIETNIKKLKADLGNSCDLIIREIESKPLGRKVVFAFIEGLVDTTSVSEFTIQSVMDEIGQIPDVDKDRHTDEVVKVFRERAFNTGEIIKTSEWKKLYLHLLSGDTILLMDNGDEAIIANTKGGERRSVSEPESQTVIRGPREGFTESIRTNTALLRRKIKSPSLWLEEIQLGEVTQTDVGIMYIHGIVDEEIVKEIRKRLSVIHIDGVLESGYIEELIENTNATIFPTVFHSERPDTIAACLLEGRVAILVDGTPFVLILPTTFNMFFQASEDYYGRYDIASLVRVLRFFSFTIGLLLPSFYVAIIGYHQEMIPTSWLLKLAVQREGVPFPAFIEAFLMEGVFEILREAGVRMPRTVGNTISIVGGLVLGQAAVEAGIVSPVVVIVVSLTAISSFVSPAYNIGITARMLRFGLLLSASLMGIYGIACALLVLVLHLCSLKSLNVPYMAAYAPMIFQDWKDTLVRVPIDRMKKRPKLISRNNPVRFKEGAKGNQQADRDQNEPHQTVQPEDNP